MKSADRSNLFGSAESDLACERRRADLDIPGIDFSTEYGDAFVWERLSVTSIEGAESIGRPMGNYDTLTIPELTLLDNSEIEDAANEISEELCTVFDRLGIIPDRILVVGLGNRNLTPDSIGPRVAERVNATMHVRNLFDYECSEIAVCTPEVTAKTGMETADIVMALCERLEPDAVIAVDALASRSKERLGKTVQISDTGIFPGSGIGNGRRPLNEATLGAPVIAIGVPTIINARLLTVKDGREEMGTDTDDMFVSPKDIDTIADVVSRIIAEGINQAFGLF